MVCALRVNEAAHGSVWHKQVTILPHECKIAIAPANYYSRLLARVMLTYCPCAAYNREIECALRGNAMLIGIRHFSHCK